MNKTVVSLIVILVIGLGGFLFLPKSSPKIGTPVTQEASEAIPSSRYVEYSKTILDQSKDLRRVLYFYATWCPTCKAANEDFLANPNKIPEDVVLIRINYNDPDTDAEEKDLAKKYGITYQHTFVQIDAEGNQIAKWNGGQTEELIANIK